MDPFSGSPGYLFALGAGIAWRGSPDPAALPTEGLPTPPASRPTPHASGQAPNRHHRLALAVGLSFPYNPRRSAHRLAWPPPLARRLRLTPNQQGRTKGAPRQTTDHTQPQAFLRHTNARGRL